MKHLGKGMPAHERLAEGLQETSLTAKKTKKFIDPFSDVPIPFGYIIQVLYLQIGRCQDIWLLPKDHRLPRGPGRYRLLLCFPTTFIDPIFSVTLINTFKKMEAFEKVWKAWSLGYLYVEIYLMTIFKVNYIETIFSPYNLTSTVVI